MSGAYVANTLTYQIHRNPPRCPTNPRAGMRLGSVDVWMALRGPGSRWLLCDRCFSSAEQAMLYDQAKAGRPVEA